MFDELMKNSTKRLILWFSLFLSNVSIIAVTIINIIKIVYIDYNPLNHSFV